MMLVIPLRGSFECVIFNKQTKRLNFAPTMGRKISTPDLVDASDSSHSNELSGKGSEMQESLDSINKQLSEQSKKISSIQSSLDRLSFAPKQTNTGLHIQTIIYIGIGLLIHSLGTGTGGTSIWGGDFKDEFVSTLKHDRPYTVSMANANYCQFKYIKAVHFKLLKNKH